MAEPAGIEASPGRHLHTNISLARGDSAAGLVVVGDQPGLPRQMSELCDRLADHGFSAEALELGTDWLTYDGAADDRWAADLARCRDHLATRMGTGGIRIGLLGFGRGGAVVLRVAGQVSDAWSAVAAFACPAESLVLLHASGTVTSDEPGCPARLFYGADEPQETIEIARRFASRAWQAGTEVAVVVDHDHSGTSISPSLWNRLIAFLDVALTFDYTTRSRGSG